MPAALLAAPSAALLSLLGPALGLAVGALLRHAQQTGDRLELAASDLARSPSWRALGGDRALQEVQALEARHGSTAAACKALGL